MIGSFRHLPVLSDTGEVIGVISIGDLVRNVLYNFECGLEDLKVKHFGAHALFLFVKCPLPSSRFFLCV